jgi:hypothetical protein
MTYINSNGNKFAGNLLIEGTCGVDGGTTTPGLNSSCVGTGISAGLTTTRMGVAGAASLVGRISVEDTTNVSDTGGLGASSFPSLPETWDWIHFDQSSVGPFDLFKGWGLAAGTFPSGAQSGRWRSNGGTSQIYDVSLRAADTVLRNTTGDGQTQNAAITSAVTCPAWLSGNTVVTDANNTYTYLMNAVEIGADSIGNENGLCESGEACIAAPNFGAYQGDGNPMAQTCLFQSGTITGVTMYYFPINGR